MALDRAVQSAVFYYLSCAPCLDARYRKKQKQEAARSRAERALAEDDSPTLYRHPSPSSTNPYWNAEIALGPNLTSRGKRKGQNADARRPKAGRLSANVSGEPSSVDLSGTTSLKRSDSGRNLRPYQREDEDLWGSTNNLSGSMYAESIRRPPTAMTKESVSSNFQSFRNPPINDFHPATVTKVNSRDEVLWMLQPPPLPEIMSGKERVSRSRSDSGGSRISPGSVLSRQVSNRLMQQRLRTGEGSTPMSRQTSSRASNRSTGQRHDQSANTSERDFAIIYRGTESKESAGLAVMDNGSEGSSNTIVRRPSLAPDPINKQNPRRTASRPQLSTIASDNSLPFQNITAPESNRDSSKENSQPSIRHSSEGSREYRSHIAQRSAILVDGESFHVVEHLKPRSAGGKIVRTATNPEASDIRLQLHGLKSDDSEDAALNIRPEMFDSWYTPDFELPKWVHEHTKREVKQRWSMDL